MAARELTFKVWDEQVRGTDPDAKERGITRQEDWRDPDEWIDFQKSKVYSRDEAFNAHRGAVEPDWNAGWYVARYSDNKILIEGKGEPPPVIKASLLNGRVLMGALIARDDQYHG